MAEAVAAGSRTRASAIGLSLLLSLGGCAARAIPPDPGPPNQPRASWTLRVGSPSSRGKIVCRSDLPAQQCVVPIGNGERPVFVAVSAYLYPPGDKTTYKGYFFSSFLGDFGYESYVNYEADPATPPALLSHFGPAVDAPGAYEFLLSLEADTPDGSRKFEVKIPVRLVRALE